MTFPIQAATLGYPSFRTLADANDWAVRAIDTMIALRRDVQALTAQLRISQAAAIADISAPAVTDPADAPANADALRDDIVANTIPSIETELSNHRTAINSILAAMRTNRIIAT